MALPRDLMQRLRLIPIVIFATSSLLLLKGVGLVAGSGYTLAGLADARAQSLVVPPPQALDAQSDGEVLQANAQAPRPKSWAQEMLSYPDATGSTASPPAAQPAAQGAPPAKTPVKPMDGKPATLDERPQLSPGERAVLDRLQERRQELDAFAKELEIREGLLKAAEKRLEARLAELKHIEAKLKSTGHQKDEVEVSRLKSVVSMYENMKPKEAARIFDRLEMRVLIDVASQINPRRMSDILAQMSPEAAEKLTVEMAARAAGIGPRAQSPNDLPKIEGRPRS